MKNSAAFKQIARDALSGNWAVAVGTGFVASLIGANLASGFSGGSSFGDGSSSGMPNDLQMTDFVEVFYAVILIIFVLLAIWSIAKIVIGGAAKLGYAKFNLNLVDKKQAAFSNLFSQFNRLGTGFGMNFFIALYVALWSLLFIIPGIIKSYSYAMTPYILAENPEMTANEAITESRRIMKGKKGRLFCLKLSFVGWALLCALPPIALFPLIYGGSIGLIVWLILLFAAAILGSSFLVPYQEAAQAAFYREISNTGYWNFKPVTEEQENEDVSN